MVILDSKIFIGFNVIQLSTNFSSLLNPSDDRILNQWLSIKNGENNEKGKKISSFNGETGSDEKEKKKWEWFERTGNIDDHLFIVGSATVLGDGRRWQGIIGDGNPSDGSRTGEGQPSGHRRHIATTNARLTAVRSNFDGLRRATSDCPRCSRYH